MTTPKIVALNGGPHRAGNTVTLMTWVVEGCLAAGASVEWLHIVDHDLRYCQGCMRCLQAGVCSIWDDLAHIRSRLLASDGIVVGSPVYEGSPPAQMKTLMDRLTLLNLYTRTFARQKTIGVATSGVAPTGGVARTVADFFGQGVAIIGAKTTSIERGYTRLGETENIRLRERAAALGERLVAEIRSPNRRWLPTPIEVWFRLFLWPYVVRPLVTRHPEQFAGVIRIWKEQGMAPASTMEGLGQ
jgi:multimeric flavodoxin WrbA